MGTVVVERRRFGGWVFEMGQDSGSSTPGEVGVWLVEAPVGAELATGHLRSFYFEASAWAHAERFCREVAGDRSYRTEIARGALAFQKRDQVYERSLQWMDTSVGFGPRSALAVGPGVTAAQGRANVAAMHRASERRDAAALGLLRFVEDHLDQIPEVSPAGCEPSWDVLDPEIAPALNDAGIETVFSCQGIDGLLVIDGVELEQAAAQIDADGDVALQEWRQGHLRLVSSHPSRNRSFRQAVAGLGRSWS